jgi:hypothetical protein
MAHEFLTTMRQVADWYGKDVTVGNKGEVLRYLLPELEVDSVDDERIIGRIAHGFNETPNDVIHAELITLSKGIEQYTLDDRGPLRGMISFYGKEITDRPDLDVWNDFAADIQLFDDTVEVITLEYDTRYPEHARLLGEMGLDHLAMAEENQLMSLVYHQDRVLGPRSRERLGRFVLCSMVEGAEAGRTQG